MFFFFKEFLDSLSRDSDRLFLADFLEISWQSVLLLFIDNLILKWQHLDE